MSKVVLYGNNCPKCRILAEKLSLKNIDFEENNNVESLISMGFMSIPVLEVDGNFMNFQEANSWVNNQKLISEQETNSLVNSQETISENFNEKGIA